MSIIDLKMLEMAKERWRKKAPSGGKWGVLMDGDFTDWAIQEAARLDALDRYQKLLKDAHNLDFWMRECLDPEGCAAHQSCVWHECKAGHLIPKELTKEN